MLGFSKKPAAPRHPSYIFDDKIDEAIAEARKSGVRLEAMAFELEKRAQALRIQHANVAPLGY